MSNYLLDTHTFLWMRFDENKLSDKAKRSIKDINNNIYISVASLWEITIKYSLGKIILPDKPDIYIQNIIYQEELSVLPISPVHALRIYTIPQLHKDPFDRILIIQSITDKIPILTKDKMIIEYKEYGLKTIW